MSYLRLWKEPVGSASGMVSVSECRPFCLLLYMWILWKRPVSAKLETWISLEPLERKRNELQKTILVFHLCSTIISSKDKKLIQMQANVYECFSLLLSLGKMWWTISDIAEIWFCTFRVLISQVFLVIPFPNLYWYMILIITLLLYGYNSTRALIGCQAGIIFFYYMALSHKDWELPNSWIWLAETDIDRGLDFPI